MPKTQTLPTQKLFIGGQLVEARSGETFATVNPATGETICHVHSAGPEDVERAVAAAEAGFAVWSAMTGAERGRILNRAAQLLRQHNRELAELEVLDTGKPIQEAEAVDVLSGADCIEYFAGLAAEPCAASTSSSRTPSSIRGASRSASAPGSAPGTTRSRSPAGNRPRLSPAATP